MSTVNLKKKRGYFKGQLTKFNVLLNAENPNLTEIKLRLDKFSELWHNFQVIQEQFEKLNLSDSEYENELAERTAFEDLYYSLGSKARKMLEAAESANTLTPNSDPNNPVNPINYINSVNQAQVGVKLPTITLPTFYGDYDKWLQFHDTFRSLIHNNTNLDDIQRLHYLKASLKGEAARVIHSIDTTADNYASAWKKLEERFDNKKLVIHNHVRALFELKNITKDNSQSLHELLDEASSHLRALASLNQPNDHWDTLIIYLLSSKFDQNTKKEWEEKVSTIEMPTFKDISTFITSRCHVLEAIAPLKQFSTNSKFPNNNNQRGSTVQSRSSKGTSLTNSYAATANYSCPICQNSHGIYNCESFLNMDVASRLEKVNKIGCCFNCLRTDHQTKECRSRGCRVCGKRHNTLIHTSNSQTPGKRDSKESSANTIDSTKVIAHASPNLTEDVILSTALVYVYDHENKPHLCRAVLDCCSQSNIITRNLCQKLQLPVWPIDIKIGGVNNANSSSSGGTTITVGSRINNFRATLNCLIVDEATAWLPTKLIDRKSLKIPENLILADPKFDMRAPIDLILGAGIFWELLAQGQIRLARGLAILKRTVLGWIVAGDLQSPKSTQQMTICNLTTNEKLQKQVEAFWKIEEMFQPTKNYSREETACERLFEKTTTRNESGRFVVSLPLKDSPDALGESKPAAIKRFYNLERKLAKDSSLYDQYIAFMKDYDSQGHMTEIIPESMDPFQVVNYLPHHVVIKDSSSTTRVRVVFDGSFRTTSGVSINDIQMVGPTVQDGLFSVVLRYRQHTYVLNADISKMYRQILIKEEQRPLQCIIWRENPSSPLKTFQLNTVTYGMASSSFLATRCLQQIGHDHQDSHPEAAKAIIHDFYVDDLLTGANTIPDLIKLKNEITSLLGSSGIQLHKWGTNEPSIKNLMEPTSGNKPIREHKEIKPTLGLLWNSESDTFHYSLSVSESEKITKRFILSTVSKIFDPLGLINPITVKAKIFLQELWKEKLEWDTPLPVNLEKDRHALCGASILIDLHAFSDASESAYGSCLYLVSKDNFGNRQVRLLCSKSRVAPLQKQTLARLELCGALLSAQLIQKATQALTINIDRIFCWSDSTITLAWIRSSPHKWETFITNRISKIQELVENAEWKYVSTKDNPADILSRGVDPVQLTNSSLWWNGPCWILRDVKEWPSPPNNTDEKIPGLKSTVCNVTTQKTTNEILLRYSNINRLRNVVAYCLRFFNNVKIPKKDADLRKLGSLKIDECNSAMARLLKIVQEEHFQYELTSLRSNKKNNVPNDSKLITLAPFLDKDGLIRVGGRLNNSDLSYEQKHPIILPAYHNLTKMIIGEEHQRLMHAGCQAVLASIRSRYWPLSGRNAVRQVIQRCIPCFKVRPKAVQPFMGDLPAHRVKPSKPFNVCGIDYGGPFSIKEGKTLGRKIVKGYVCLIVCFSTKAIHLELADSLSTDSFLNCFRRFTARRGKSSDIYSDNGTNFVGANNELAELHTFLTSPEHSKTFEEFFRNDNTQWHFIPPGAPHFGGLWESGIKSVKYHLKRVLGNACLTFEEFYTVLTQIEACLNSRPISALSEDPNDLEALTPGHFLIGQPLMTLPGHNFEDVNENRLNRYERLQQMYQHFWRRWHHDYLHGLQLRYKWNRQADQNVNLGALVIVKDDRLPPMKWPLGRIIELHPGKDSIVRTVTLRVSNGTMRRPVVKICLLPVEVVNGEPK